MGGGGGGREGVGGWVGGREGGSWWMGGGRELVGGRRAENNSWPFSMQFSTMATQNLIMIVYRGPIKISVWLAKPEI